MGHYTDFGLPPIEHCIDFILLTDHYINLDLLVSERYIDSGFLSIGDYIDFDLVLVENTLHPFQVW